MATRRKSTAIAGNHAVLYIRVSTERQAVEGISLDAQEQALRAYCAHRGLKVVEVVADPAQSASRPLVAREGGRKVLDLVRRKQVDAVVVFKLDRAFRNAADCLAVVAGWDKAGIALHLTDLGGQAVDTSTAIGKMFLTVLAGFAEFERNQTAERVTMALAGKVARGDMRIGGIAPYGFQYDGPRLAPVEHEQAVITLARQLRDDGQTLRSICAALNAAGHTNRAGREFAPQTVKNLLDGALRLQAA